MCNKPQLIPDLLKTSFADHLDLPFPQYLLAAAGFDKKIQI
jgi:hypothetical protein